MPNVLARVGRRAPLLGALIVTVTLGASWLLSGVTVGEASRFLAFEALYVLLPGCMLYVLLSPSLGGWLHVIAIGWPLGYALEIGAFSLTAAIGAREAFTFLPAIAIVTMGPLIYGRARALPAVRLRLRSRLRVPERGQRLDILAVALALALALGLLGLRFFASYPLPEDAHSVYYLADNLYHISIAAEARHHWPVTAPYVAGTPLRYYIGVFLHFAAVNQVTGIALSTVVLRLAPSTMILVTALQLWLLGGLLGRSRWTGPIAVALFLVVEDLNLDPTRASDFSGEFFNAIPGSPTAALGEIFFLGLLALVHQRFVGRSQKRGVASAGWLVLVGVLVLGMSAAKIFAAVDFLGGLGLYWLWRLATGRLDRWLSYCLAVSVICALIIQHVLLSGDELSPTLAIRPLAFVEITALWPLLSGHSAVRVVLLVVCAVAVCICLLAPLAGSVWLLFKPSITSPFSAFLVAMFTFSFLAFVSLTFLNESLIYLIWYGYIAMVPVAAMCLISLWNSIPERSRRELVKACVVTLTLGIAMAGSTRVLTAMGVLTVARRTAWYVWYGVAYGSVGGLVLFFALRLERNLGSVLASRTSRVVACCLPIVVTLGLVKPVALGAPRLFETVFHERVSVSDSPRDPGITAALYKGLIWVRNHTTPCDVLAVNTHYRNGVEDSQYPYYSAFTERRIFLEAWNTTVQGARGEQAYPARFALNTKATRYGDVAALRELERIGVSYVMIDETHGGGAQEPSSTSRLVFKNSALEVYRLLAPSARVDAPRKCATIAWSSAAE